MGLDMYLNARKFLSQYKDEHQPIINDIEMGFVPAIGGVTALITKMQSSTYYPDLFTFAFGDAAITETRIQQALARLLPEAGP